MKSKTMNTSFLLLPLVAAALTGCGRNTEAKNNTDKDATSVMALPVRTQVAKNRVFERRLTVQGTLEAKRFANVAARVGGNLDAIWVYEGDAVIAGETPLFQIDPVGLSNAVTVAEQDLAIARAGRAVAQASTEKITAEARKAALDYERYDRLFKEKKVSPNEYELADTIHRQAQAGIAVAAAQVALADSQASQAEAALTIARKELDDALVVAPLSGIVSLRGAEPGEQMAIGRRILQIVDLELIEAAAFLPASYYADIVLGTTSFRLDVNGRPAGTHAVTYRSPTINPVLRTFEIKGIVDNTTGVAVPGSMADVTLVFESRQGVGAPGAAVLARASHQVVFIVRDGKAVQTTVVTGFENDGCIEILSGLEDGAEIVTEGQTQLRDGQPVTVL